MCCTFESNSTTILCPWDAMFYIFPAAFPMANNIQTENFHVSTLSLGAGMHTELASDINSQGFIHMYLHLISK